MTNYNDLEIDHNIDDAALEKLTEIMSEKLADYIAPTEKVSARCPECGTDVKLHAPKMAKTVIQQCYNCGLIFRGSISRPGGGDEERC